ncbi:MAG: DNA translocase FtsK [Candidatus Omnitrophota bacterium]
MRRIPPAFLGLILIPFSIVLFLSLFSYTPSDIPFISFPHNTTPRNLIGLVGAYAAFSLLFIAGYSSYFVPLYFFLLGLDRLGWVKFRGIACGKFIKIISFCFFLASIASLIGLFLPTKGSIYLYSGLIGSFLSGLLNKYLGFWGAFILLSISTLVFFWMLVGFFFIPLFTVLKDSSLSLKLKIAAFFEERKKPETKAAVKIKQKIKPLRPREDLTSAVRKESKPEIRVYTPKPAVSSHGESVLSPAQNKQDISQEDRPGKPYDPKTYRLPSIDILKNPPPVDSGQVTEDIQANIRNLEETLTEFGVGAKVVSVQKGPVVTMYELEPYPGVKIQSITTLSDDIALAMKAAGVRIVAPIPGRGTVGIEIPNAKKLLVFLREVLEEKVFISSNSKLILAIGKDVKGDPIVAELKDMPHLLIAGTTGSGKTVCVNSIISSILFKAKPNEVKFILIDPKKVELAPYSGIPHLLHPIISDAKGAFSALNWAVEEMENRYKCLAKEGVRNIDSYNRREARMPYIVIIVDELADLMIVARDKIETTIQRLAQLSRAVGIHLILATQRPSVDVITGVIKANFPARISFKVSSRVDSRTVLDVMGAEKLLGKGDCLFIKPGLVKSIRAQSAFIDEEDTAKLTDFIRTQGAPVYEEGILEVEKKTEARLESDELLDEAVKVVLFTKQASASLLQRRLRVGYTRAARLLDLMEQASIVGPFCGSKAREILVDPETYLKENNKTQ